MALCNYCGDDNFSQSRILTVEGNIYHESCIRHHSIKRNRAIEAFRKFACVDTHILCIAINVSYLFGLTGKEDKKTKKEKRSNKIREFSNKVSALRNSNSGKLVVHLVGLSKDDKFTGYFDEFADETLTNLIQDGSLFTDVYEKQLLCDCDDVEELKEFTDFLVLSVEGASYLTTSEFNTKKPLDDRIVDTTDQELLTFLKKRRQFEEKFHDPGIQSERDLNELRESRSIQLKEYFPLKEDKISVATSLIKKLRLTEYISAFTKLPKGGSYFYGVAEKEKTYPGHNYKSKVPGIQCVPIEDTASVERELKGEITKSVLVCDYDGGEITDIDLIQVRFIPSCQGDAITCTARCSGDRGHFVIQISVKPVSGIAFYDCAGPVAYRVEKDSITLYTVKEWFRLFKERSPPSEDKGTNTQGTQLKHRYNPQPMLMESNLKLKINEKEEHEFSLKSNDFLRLPLRQIGDSIYSIKRYYFPKGGINPAPSALQPPLTEIKDDLFERLENRTYLHSRNIVTGTNVPEMEKVKGFVFLSETLGLALDFPVLQRPSDMKCDSFIALPHQPVLVLTLVDGDRESDAARIYNTHVAREVTRILRKFIDESINVVFGVMSITDLKSCKSFQVQVSKCARVSSHFATKISFSMSPSKYEKVLTAFWAGVAETKSVLVGGEEDKDYLRFLTKEQCIVLVENINSREVTVTCQPGSGASTLMLEVARRLSNLEETLLVCRSKEERDRLTLIYPNTVAASDIPSVELEKFKHVVDETGTVGHTPGRIWQFTKDGNDLFQWLKMRVRISEMQRHNIERLQHLLAFGARQRRLQYLEGEADALYLLDLMLQGYKTFHRLSGSLDNQHGQNSGSRDETGECYDHLMEQIQQVLQKQQSLFPVLGNLMRQERKLMYILQAKAEHLEKATKLEGRHRGPTMEQLLSVLETQETGDGSLQLKRKNMKLYEPVTENQEADSNLKTFYEVKPVIPPDTAVKQYPEKIVDNPDTVADSITDLKDELVKSQRDIYILEKELSLEEDRAEWEHSLECLSGKIAAMSIQDDVKEIIGEEVLPVPLYQADKKETSLGDRKTSVSMVHHLHNFQHGKLRNRDMLAILENVMTEHQGSLFHLQSWSTHLERVHGSPIYIVGQVGSPRWSPVSCPPMTLDSDRVNSDWCQVTENGELRNSPRPGKRLIGGFRNYLGTCSRLHIPLPSSPSTVTTPRYWETQTRVRVVGQVSGLWLPLLEMGVSQEGEVDTGHWVSSQRHSWTVRVGGCFHHSPGICTQVWGEGRQVGDCRPDTVSNTLGTTAVLHYGVVLDIETGTVAFIDLDREIVFYRFHVKFREPLRPMFCVGSSSFYTVEMRLVSGREIKMTDTKKDLISQALTTT